MKRHLVSIRPEEHRKTAAPTPVLDRSAIRELLKLTPAERARLAVEEARKR